MIVVLPVAGRGSRFGAVTTQLPKCLLPVAGRPMLCWALESLRFRPEDLVVVYHVDQREALRARLESLVPHAQLVEQRTPLRGAADSVFAARERWCEQRNVVVIDCDVHARSRYSEPDWEREMGDGSVLTFGSDSASKSYVQERDGRVVGVVEKEVVSARAVGGIYHFESGPGLASAIGRQLSEERIVKGEYYLSGAVNLYLETHPDFRSVPASRFFDLGTPSCVEDFERDGMAA